MRFSWAFYVGFVQEGSLRKIQVGLRVCWVPFQGSIFQAHAFKCRCLTSSSAARDFDTRNPQWPFVGAFEQPLGPDMQAPHEKSSFLALLTSSGFRFRTNCLHLGTPGGTLSKGLWFCGGAL